MASSVINGHLMRIKKRSCIRLGDTFKYTASSRDTMSGRVASSVVVAFFAEIKLSEVRFYYVTYFPSNLLFGNFARIKLS